MTGYANYNVIANAQGQFTIPGVYANQVYNFTASAVGYQNYVSTVSVGGNDLPLGAGRGFLPGESARLVNEHRQDLEGLLLLLQQRNLISHTGTMASTSVHDIRRIRNDRMSAQRLLQLLVRVKRPCPA